MPRKRKCRLRSAFKTWLRGCGLHCAASLRRYRRQIAPLPTIPLKSLHRSSRRHYPPCARYASGILPPPLVAVSFVLSPHPCRVPSPAGCHTGDACHERHAVYRCGANCGTIHGMEMDASIFAEAPSLPVHGDVMPEAPWFHAGRILFQNPGLDNARTSPATTTAKWSCAKIERCTHKMRVLEYF